VIVTTLLFLTTWTSAMTALWINNPGFDTDHHHRHRHRGGMLTKTPPPTEFQIPATVTTLLHTKWHWHLDASSSLAQQKWAENWGMCPLFWGGGAGSPSSTMWPGSRLTSIPIEILIHPAVWPQQTWAKNWGSDPFLGRGSWVPI